VNFTRSNAPVDQPTPNVLGPTETRTHVSTSNSNTSTTDTKLHLVGVHIRGKCLYFIILDKLPHLQNNISFCWWLNCFGVRGQGYSAKFYMGRLRPEVQPVRLLYNNWQKKYPFCIPLIEKRYPIHILS